MLRINKKLNIKKTIIGISKLKKSKLYILLKFNFLTINLVILKFIKKVTRNEKIFIDGTILIIVSTKGIVSTSFETFFSFKNSFRNFVKY